MSKIKPDVLKYASDKKFTEFSAAVKQALKDKLANHKDIKKYVSDYDKINQMKDMFNKITTINKEPKEQEPKEPEPKEQEPKEP